MTDQPRLGNCYSCKYFEATDSEIAQSRLSATPITAFCHSPDSSSPSAITPDIHEEDESFYKTQQEYLRATCSAYKEGKYNAKIKCPIRHP